jgi:basic membrane protein A
MGNFQAGNYIGTLENGGVGITYSSGMIDQIPAELQAEIEELQAQIIAGEIQTLP